MKFIKKFFEGNYSKEELPEIYKLSKEDSFKQKAFDFLSEEWNNFEENNYIEEKEIDKIYEKTKKIAKIQKRHILMRTAKFAASIALLILLTFFLHQQLQLSDTEFAYTEISTKKGETKKIYLSKGIEVVLNAESKIRYPKKITKENREILIEGGAYFNLPHKSVELLINIDDLTLTTAGESSFNISSYPENEEIVVAIENGNEIQISMPALLLTPAMTNEEAEKFKKENPQEQNSRQNMIVSRDNFFSYNKGLKQYTKDIYEDKRTFFAWLNGDVFFNNPTAGQVVKELSRTFNVEFDIQGCFHEDMVLTG